jgi:hypothetical protein
MQPSPTALWPEVNRALQAETSVTFSYTLMSETRTTLRQNISPFFSAVIIEAGAIDSERLAAPCSAICRIGGMRMVAALSPM